MERKWKYLLGGFLLAVGLLLGCAEKSEQPPQRIQVVESQEAENQETENPVAEGVLSEMPKETEEGIHEAGDFEKVQELEQMEALAEDATYISKEEVAEYIFIYGHLPDNFITKKEAKALGWVSSEGNLGEVAPGKSIGGDYFGNFEGNLPEKKGREYHECDIDSSGGYRGAKRIVYSNDGLVYYTEDHYKTFELLYGEE